MGYGDDIMATAEARRRQEAGDLRPCVYVNKHSKPIASPVFDNNPRFTGDMAKVYDLVGVQILAQRSGNRPYIDYANSTRTKWAWRDAPPEPGEIYLSAAERAAIPKMTPFIVVEPTIKAAASPNKDWGWDNWQRLVTDFGANRFLQLGPPGTRGLAGVQHRVTDTIRDAFVVLAGAAAYVGHEGALHHAAAALGIPAVVIFGGYVSPRQTGYEFQTNLYPDDPHSPCGMRVACPHCKRVMQSISVDQVAAALAVALQRS
jgi:hypothetical protein